MTAAIVNAWGDARPADELERAAEERQSEHNLHSSKRAVPCETCGRVHAGEPGQLWERVAEMGDAGVVNSRNYTARIADAFRTVQRARREYRVGMRNVSTIRLTPAGECTFYREMDAHYGTSKSSPLHHSQRCPIHTYRHTGFEAGAL